MNTIFSNEEFRLIRVEFLIKVFNSKVEPHSRYDGLRRGGGDCDEKMLGKIVG